MSLLKNLKLLLQINFAWSYIFISMKNVLSFSTSKNRRHFEHIQILINYDNN